MSEVKKCPDCGGKIGGVEYAYPHPEQYDGISEWYCINECGYRIGRWSGKRLKEGESEKRYGGKS